MSDLIGLEFSKIKIVNLINKYLEKSYLNKFKNIDLLKFLKTENSLMQIIDGTNSYFYITILISPDNIEYIYNNLVDKWSKYFNITFYDYNRNINKLYKKFIENHYFLNNELYKKSINRYHKYYDINETLIFIRKDIKKSRKSKQIIKKKEEYYETELTKLSSYIIFTDNFNSSVFDKYDINIFLLNIKDIISNNIKTDYNNIMYKYYDKLFYSILINDVTTISNISKYVINTNKQININNVNIEPIIFNKFYNIIMDPNFKLSHKETFFLIEEKSIEEDYFLRGILDKNNNNILISKLISKFIEYFKDDKSFFFNTIDLKQIINYLRILQKYYPYIIQQLLLILQKLIPIINNMVPLSKLLEIPTELLKIPLDEKSIYRYVKTNIVMHYENNYYGYYTHLFEYFNFYVYLLYLFIYII